MVFVGRIGTIGRESKLTIPSELRKKYALRRGGKIEFVETSEGIILVPLISLRELRVAARDHYDSVMKGIETLERGKKRSNLLKKSKLPVIVHSLAFN